MRSFSEASWAWRALARASDTVPGRASTMAEGTPRLTSSAKVGPERAPTGTSSTPVSAWESVWCVLWRMPLLTWITSSGAPGALGRRLRQASGVTWVGMAEIQSGAAKAAAGSSEVSSRSGNSTSLSRRCRRVAAIWAISSGKLPHSATLAPARAQVMARAVPQAPEPKTPMSALDMRVLLLGTPELGFGARLQAQDVLPVLPDDQDGKGRPGEDRRRALAEQLRQGPVRAPGQEELRRHHGRRQDAAQADVAGEPEGEEEGAHGQEHHGGIGGQDHAKGRGDALPALELQPGSEHVAQHRRQGKEGHHVHAHARLLRQVHGDEALGAVQSQR